MSLAAPQTTRYRPEEILVCKSAVVPANAEWQVDAWRRIPPNFMIFNFFATENIASGGGNVAGARIRVTADAEPNVYDEHADACLPLNRTQLAGIFAHRLMLVCIANVTVNPMAAYQFRYRYLVDSWTVAEKIRRKMLKEDGDFSSEELRLDRKFNLRENIAAGRLPYQFPLSVTERLKQETVIRIQEVARNIDVIAAGSVANTALQSDVGPRITVPEDEKVVLFEIATDQPTDPAHQTFIAVDRDIDQPDYLLLNTYCFGETTAPAHSIDHPENLWVPTPEEMYLHARSVVGETHFKIRYKYARCDLTLIDKIRWNLDMDSSEVATADKLDLWDRIAAGIAHLPSSS